MDNYEVFKYPTVKEVAFEVRFSEIFFMEKMIGDFQLEIMESFPISKKLEKPYTIIFEGENSKFAETSNKTRTTWQFLTETRQTTVLIRSDRLNILTKEFKTYNHPDHPRFRDIITEVVSRFLDKFPIKQFERIGLRYIDHCPLEEKNNNYFKNYYEPIFDIEKFKLEDIIENFNLFRLKKENYELLFQSGIRKISDDYNYFMDFDGYTKNISINEYLDHLDKIFVMINDLYFDNITEEFKKYMRGEL